MKKCGPLALPRFLLLLACAGCACGEGSATSEEPESSTTGEDGSTGASSSTGSSTAETTEAGSSEATGFDTTPPETSSTTDASSSGSSDSSGSSTTGGDDAVTVEVTYAFATQAAGVPLDCAAAGTSWVDVTVVDAADPDDRTYDLEDLPCDDTVVSVGPLPSGTYSIGVVAWDQNLWHGSSGDFVVDGSTDPLQLEIGLSQVPNP